MENRFLNVLRYLYARCGEASTIRGLIVLGGSLLYANQPDRIEEIATSTGILVGVIGMLFPDITVPPKLALTEPTPA